MTLSIKKILWTDYKLMASAIAIVALLLLPPLEAYFGLMSYLHSLYSDYDPAEGGRIPLLDFLKVFCPALALLLTGYLLVRLTKFYRLFNNATLVQGKLLGEPHELRLPLVKLRYTYNIDGQAHESDNLVYGNKAVKALNIDDPVELAVNAQRPGQALLANLYRA